MAGSSPRRTDRPQLYAVLKLRCAVFVVEQSCVYQDIDGDDLVGENRHLLGWRGDELVAYARILKSDDEFEPVVIGRVIISPAARGEAGLSADGTGAGQLPSTLAAKAIYLMPVRTCKILRQLRFCTGDRSLRRGRHRPYRHGVRNRHSLTVARIKAAPSSWVLLFLSSTPYNGVLLRGGSRAVCFHRAGKPIPLHG